MPTDTERREAARRLREFTKDNQWPLTVGGNSSTIRYAISDIVFGDKKYHSGVDLLDRLADLIDPDTTSDRTKTAEDTTKAPNSHPNCGTPEVGASQVPKCDRDALLALAEDVDGAADDSGVFEPLAGMLRDIARRIREACGERAS